MKLHKVKSVLPKKISTYNECISGIWYERPIFEFEVTIQFSKIEWEALCDPTLAQKRKKFESAAPEILGGFKVSNMLTFFLPLTASASIVKEEYAGKHVLQIVQKAFKESGL